MREITRVGVDLAKHVIQVHAIDASGKLVTNHALPRDKFFTWCAQLPAGCLIAMEASSSAHHWARKLLTQGLDARIIAAHLVAPYRLQGKSGKNDANDAAAICEAASRPQMHFVPIKTIDQQSMLCVHRLREDPISKWAYQLREKSGWQKAAVALSNKNARILWAIFVRGAPFDARHVSVKPTAGKLD